MVHMATLEGEAEASTAPSGLHHAASLISVSLACICAVNALNRERKGANGTHIWTISPLKALILHVHSDVNMKECLGNKK